MSPSACRPTLLGAFLQIASFADASSNAVSLREKQMFLVGTYQLQASLTFDFSRTLRTRRSIAL